MPPSSSGDVEGTLRDGPSVGQSVAWVASGITPAQWRHVHMALGPRQVS